MMTSCPITREESFERACGIDVIVDRRAREGRRSRRAPPPGAPRRRTRDRIRSCPRQRNPELAARPAPSLDAVSVPACRSTSRRASVSPTPRPPWARSGDRSLWKNRSKIRGNRSAEIPIPLSRTQISIVPSRSPASIAISPPWLGELGGVAQDVGHDLDETDPVSVDHERVSASGTVW